MFVRVKIALAVCAVVASATIAAAPAPAAAAPKISQAQWKAFVAQTALGRCDPQFVPTFGSNAQNFIATKTVALASPAFKNFDYGTELEKPMKTTVRTTDPQWNMSTLTVERYGEVVSFLLEMPGGSTRGFFLATGAPSVIGMGSRTFADRLVRNVPTSVLSRGAVVRCGLTRVGIREAGTPQDEGATVIELRGNTVVGFEQSEGG